MAIRLYKDAELASSLSEGDWTNPDGDIYDGTHGQSYDRRLYLANEYALLAAPLDAVAINLNLQSPGFANGEVVIADDEQMKIVAGGGTAAITVQRGYAGSTPAVHAAGTTVFSGYNYTGISVGVVDTADSDEASWYRFALTREGLDEAAPGVPLALADKTYLQTLSFWRRCTVPSGTPVQNKTDLLIRVTGVENPLP